MLGCSEVSWEGVTNTGDKDKSQGMIYCGGVSDEWWRQWQKNCDVGEFKTDRTKSSGHIVGWDVTVRALPADWWWLMSSWCGRPRCARSPKCSWCLRIVLWFVWFLWCVDPALCFLWMPNVHFKFEKLKGEYTISSKRYELEEQKNLLDAHVSKIISGPIKWKLVVRTY
jgi:hypothetical protein